MSSKDPLSDDLNQKSKIPQIKSGLFKYREGGEIKANWQEIKWTRQKILLVSIILGVPYLTAIIASFVNRIYLIAFILLGLAVIIVVLFKIVRWLERNEF
jgi:hypothetical protein